jgi:pimeloyl-ACP methyl ester carboxylesterase
MESVTSADGTRIAYERHGDGQPLVLVHGGSKPQYWMPVVPRLADEYAVVVPHRRGHGESGENGSYGLEKEVEDISAVLDAIDGDPALFGHSFGGLVALETARFTPVDRLVAYEPGVLVDEYREQADLAAKMQAELDAGDPVEATKVYVREVIHGGDVDDLDAWLEAWPPWPGLADIAENITRMNRAIESYRLPETLDIEAPTLLLTGTEGPPHLRESVREVHAALPDSRLVEFDGVSHAGPVEAPDRVLGAVRGFVEDADPPVAPE